MPIEPTVSVLMPIYNAERYVAEAIESTLAQTFRDFEFLIIDDGSTDRSPSILKRYAERDPRIHPWPRQSQRSHAHEQPFRFGVYACIQVSAHGSGLLIVPAWDMLISGQDTSPEPHLQPIAANNGPSSATPDEVRYIERVLSCGNSRTYGHKKIVAKRAALHPIESIG